MPLFLYPHLSLPYSLPKETLSQIETSRTTMSRKGSADVVKEEFKKELRIHAEFDEDKSRGFVVNALKTEEARIRQVSTADGIPGQHTDQITELQKEILEMEYPDSVLRRAHDYATTLCDSPDDTDVYFVVQFLALYRNTDMTNIAKRLRELSETAPSERWQHSQHKFLTGALQSEMKTAMIFAKSKEYRKDKKDSFERSVVLAACYVESHRARDILIAASKTGVVGKTKDQIKDVLLQRQPFEDALKAFTDVVHRKFSSSFNDLCSQLLPMRRIYFEAGTTAFETGKKLEALWMKGRGFVDYEAGSPAS